MSVIIPRISVIIPSFNQGQFIEETIHSLISQGYPNMEIIVIDGGSRDSTVKIIEKYQSHFTYWISEKDSGQSEAINKGFQKATGDIITWLNSDDCYEPGSLKKVADYFERNPKLSVLHGKSILFGNNTSEKIVGLSSNISLHEYFPYMRFPQPSSFIRTSALREILPVNEQLHYAMDFELIVKLLLKGNEIERSDEVFSRYRLHATSKSNDHLSFLKEWSLVVASFFNSVAGGSSYVLEMQNLNLVEKQAIKSYSAVLTFNDQELEAIWLQHLNICYHYHYRAFHKKEALLISNYIKKNYASFFQSNNFNKYNNRLIFIPKFVFNVFRSIIK